MVFGLFKKKKPQDSPSKASNTPQSGQPTSQPTSKDNSPSKNKDQNKQKKQKPQGPRLDQEEQWMFDSIVQFLQSPTWRIPILTFLDENCIIFDDEEENKFEYTETHRSFKKMVEDLVEGMMAEIGITEESLDKILQVGIQDPSLKKTFEQLLIIDNFIVFKSVMVKRNKELELEALQQLHALDNRNQQTATGAAPGDNLRPTAAVKEIEQLTLEKEQAEIEAALSLSVAVEQERKRLAEQEDYEIQEAIRQSEEEFKKHQESEKQKELDKQKQADAEKEKAHQKKNAEDKAKADAEAKAKADADAKASAEAKAKTKKEEEDKAKAIKAKVDNDAAEAQKKAQEANVKAQPKADLEEEKVAEKEPVVKSKKLEPLKEAPKLNPLPAINDKECSLPPIGGDSKFGALTTEQLQAEKDKINSKIQQIKEEEAISKESLEERKKRLKAQRDMILAKKKAEREAELKNYEANKESAPKVTTAAIDSSAAEAEAEKRRELFQKLKADL